MQQANTWGIPWLRAGLIKERTSGITVTALVMFFFSCVLSLAQSTTSAVNGTVTDATGAIVVGANITVTNVATGVTYSATSDSIGAFHVTQLPPGRYTMTSRRRISSRSPS
jgi:hypothetical protein